MSTVCVQAFRCAAPAAAAGASRNSGSGCSTSKSPSSSTSTMMKLSSRSSFLPSARRCLVISRAKNADKGGFGKADPSKQAAPVKLSKRGTISTRGGQLSKKELEQQQEVFDAIEQGKELPTGALPPSLRAPGEAGATPSRLSTSTSSTSTPLGGSEGGRPSNYNPQPEMREVSPAVNNRMFRRILAFSGVPIALGIALFPAFYYLKKVAGVDLPTWVVYFVQSITWGGGLAGISYGILSSSWDPEREGSIMGGDEFRANLGAILERGREKR